MDARELMHTLVASGAMRESESEAAFEMLLSGLLDEAQIGAMLAIIQKRGASVDELVGAARAMRRHVTRVPIEIATDEILLDTCGTGGAAKAFNISTAAALVIAGAPLKRGRILVAKHGNRSRSGRGSAEVLTALGVNIDATPAVQARCLRDAGVCFSFAIHHHPAMRHAMSARRSLGFATIFNLLGPLTNPAGAQRQLIGVYAPELVDRVAAALARLGAVRAIVAHGEGMDELCTHGATTLAHVEDGRVRSERIEARAFGLAGARPEELSARDVIESALMVRLAIGSEGLGAHPRAAAARDIVLLNAAAGLVAAQATRDLASGIALARESIESGRAAQALARLIESSHG
jgi:anthranilate phosphoribosyltransferase